MYIGTVKKNRIGYPSESVLGIHL